MTQSAFRIEKLTAGHNVDSFDCGEKALNRFLIRHALVNQKSGSTSTYVGLSGEDVVGYYSLCVGSLVYSDAADRLKKGLPRHPVPILLLARLAVQVDFQGQGLGAGLLKDTVLRTIQAADIVGIRALIVHAKNDVAKAFYEHFGFAPSPTDPYHLFALLKDLRKQTSLN